jgi:hypothetical protein
LGASDKLVLGNRVGGLCNRVSDAPSALARIKPAANLVFIGVAVYGYTLRLTDRATG